MRLHREVAARAYCDGALPQGAVVHHRCSNKRCLNPEHLQVTTAQANNAEWLERKHVISENIRLRAALSEAVAALKEISNMTKTPGLMDQAGKLTKGPNYEPPDIASVLGVKP